MYQKFADYLYYLLPAPFKRVRKAKNQWYIFLKVIGDEYDKVQSELEQALNETSVVTCRKQMLQYYAQDREMYRYQDEDSEIFRSRIAMHDEIEALGGTKAGILLAAETLGYSAEHIWYPELGYPEKWSQFLLRLKVRDKPINFEMLKREIRKVKDSTSLDNYCFSSDMNGKSYTGAAMTVKNHIRIG